MRKRIIMFLTIFLITFPISVSASKVDLKSLDENYILYDSSLKSVSCKYGKCKFENVGAAKEVEKVRITIYSDSSMQNELVAGEVKSNLHDKKGKETLSSKNIGSSDGNGKKYTYYVKINTCGGKIKSTCKNGDWVYSYHYKLTFTQKNDYSKASLKLDSVWATNNSDIYEDTIESKKTLDNLTPTRREISDAMKDDCDSSLKELIEKYWKWIIFLTPILLIVMITIDFLKAMTSGDADAIKKSSTNAFKRVIAAIILIMLPWALDVVFDWFGLQICF